MARRAAIDVTAALTYRSVAQVSNVLRQWPAGSDPHSVAAFGADLARYSGRPAAATCLTLLNIERDRKVKAAILLTVRGGKLRSHAGEVSLPGGHVDRGETPADAARRELEEETGVRHTSLLATLPPVWSRYGKEVLAHVAVSQPWPSQPDQDMELPAFSLDQLEPQSRQEVASIFAITLEELVDPARHTADHFREDPSLPYVVLDVRDKTQGFTELGRPGRADRESGLEVWGLSGWSLNMFARAVGLFMTP